MNRRRDLQIVSLDVGPDTIEAGEARALRLAEEVPEWGRKVGEVDEAGQLLWVVRRRLPQPVRRRQHRRRL